MSPKLRPLQLPLLVEQRRKFEEAQAELDVDHSGAAHVLDSASSDSNTPLTPTFSVRGHLRYSSSTSSFDLTASPPCAASDGPSSPTQSSHKPGKRVLPDVEEEPFETRDASFDAASFYDRYDLYDCLCDTQHCVHKDEDMIQSTTELYGFHGDADYDFGFLSDTDLTGGPWSTRKHRAGSDSHFVGLTQRIGSRFPALTRWKSQRKASLTNSPMSDFGFDPRPQFSRAASSRSSSLSRSGRQAPDRSNEPPVPPTPALSFFESSESIATPAPIDVEKANEIGPLIERDRELATTPLLPPLMTDLFAAPPPAQLSPLESPKVEEPLAEQQYMPAIASPPLSTKPSIASFHRVVMPAELSHIPEQDAWTDRLGHANFTILPEPYRPEDMSLESMRQLRADWDAARVSYTKHLVRTGEHYGTTSKTYAMTEAKWNEIDSLWRSYFQEIASTVVPSGAAAAAACSKLADGVLTTVPRMDTEGKFPERGDEDIVGPMVREPARSPSIDSLEKKSPGFWRSLAGRVGLRK